MQSWGQGFGVVVCGVVGGWDYEFLWVWWNAQRITAVGFVVWDKGDGVETEMTDMRILLLLL